MTLQPNARIGIIGAGSSGLAAAKNLKQCGFDNLVIWEQSERVGGNWVYSESVEHSSVYETTHIITSKKHSAFMDYPMPESYPDYPSHAQMAEYFDGYARKFGLFQHILFRTRVLKAEPGSKGDWQVVTDRSETPDLFDFLIVCNGHHWNPRMPSYPGQFSGQLLHSHSFKNNKPFAGQRVLVIGAGNSGCDAAVEVSRVAQHTAISMRRGYHFIPKFVFGKPADEVANRFQWVPDFLLDWVYALVLRLENGDIRSFGLPLPDHGVRQSHPVSNSELLYAIRHGRIKPRPDIAQLDGPVVHFTDGSSDTFDVIIAATGFKVTFPFFDPSLVQFEDREVRLYQRVWHPSLPGLAFVGLIQASGCFWKLADYQSQWLANILAGHGHLPGDLDRAIDREVDENRKWFTQSPRHLIEVDYFKYSRQLMRKIPRNAPAWVGKG